MTQEEMWTNEGPPIYLDATRIRTVKEGDADAAFLLVAAGGQIPMSVAKQYGVTEKQTELELPEVEAPEAEPLEAEPRKAKPAPNTKLRETPDNKSGQG
jgi:hypothetical protein